MSMYIDMEDLYMSMYIDMEDFAQGCQDTFYFLVVEHWAFLSLQDIEGVKFVMTTVRKSQGTPCCQLFLPRINIGL